MIAAKAKSLVGKYGLYQIGDVIDDGEVVGVSPSGACVQIGFLWYAVEKVTWLEELPGRPTGNVTEAVTATDMPNSSKVGERIKAAFPGITPSAGNDFVEEVIGLLRVAQGARDQNEKLWLETRAKLDAARVTISLAAEGEEAHAKDAKDAKGPEEAATSGGGGGATITPGTLEFPTH